MSKEKRVKATLADIIARKQQSKLDQFQVKYYYSETLDMDIEFRKIPLKEYMTLIENLDDEDSLGAMNELIYNMCPMFKQNAKEAMQVYGVSEPTDLPSAILEDQLNEIHEIIDMCNSFYGMDKTEESVKNSSSKEMPN